MRNAYKISIRKSEGRRQLRRPKHRQEDNIRMDLMEIGCVSVDWMHLAQERNQWWVLVNTVLNIWIP